MALNYADKRLNKYFDALFVIGKMGDSNKELFALHKVLSADDFAELKEFNNLHKSLVELVSRDEDEAVLQNEITLLNKYEQTADQINIAPRYKAKMYDAVLIGVDKFAPNNAHSLFLISKIVDNTPLRANNDLQRWQKVAEQYKYATNALYENLCKKIKLKISGKDPNKMEQSKKRFYEIEKELKFARPDETQISLLEEQLKLMDNCGFKRLQKFRIKANICYNLSNLCAFTMNEDKKNDYEREYVYYQGLIKNTLNHIR